MTNNNNNNNIDAQQQQQLMIPKTLIKRQYHTISNINMSNQGNAIPTDKELGKDDQPLSQQPNTALAMQEQPNPNMPTPTTTPIDQPLAASTTTASQQQQEATAPPIEERSNPPEEAPILNSPPPRPKAADNSQIDATIQGLLIQVIALQHNKANS